MRNQVQNIIQLLITLFIVIMHVHARQYAVREINLKLCAPVDFEAKR